MRGLFATAAAVLCAAGSTGFGVSVATAAEPAVLPPAGEICVYAGTTPTGTGLANLVGDHLVSDNPAGVAVFQLCTGYGIGCAPPLSAGDHIIDMTPYSSLVISRSQVRGPASTPMFGCWLAGTPIAVATSVGSGSPSPIPSAPVLSR